MKWAIVLGYFIFAPLRIAYCVYRDWNDPEAYHDPMRNPYLTLALSGVFVVSAVALAWHIWRTERAKCSCPRKGKELEVGRG